MTEITGVFGLVIIAIIAFIVLATIIMPIVVLMIDSRVAKISKTLASMEHMMRYGK